MRYHLLTRNLPEGLLTNETGLPHASLRFHSSGWVLFSTTTPHLALRTSPGQRTFSGNPLPSYKSAFFVLRTSPVAGAIFQEIPHPPKKISGSQSPLRTAFPPQFAPPFLWVSGRKWGGWLPWPCCGVCAVWPWPGRRARTGRRAGRGKQLGRLSGGGCVFASWTLFSRRVQHGCWWETFCMFAICDLVGNPHLTAKTESLLPFQRQASQRLPPT